MKSFKNIGIFLGIILIIVSSFVVDAKRKVPVRTVVVQCPTFKVVENTINTYAKYGYSVVQISPIVVKLTNPCDGHNHIYDLNCTNNFIIIMEK